MADLSQLIRNLKNTSIFDYLGTNMLSMVAEWLAKYAIKIFIIGFGVALLYNGWKQWFTGKYEGG